VVDGYHIALATAFFYSQRTGRCGWQILDLRRRYNSGQAESTNEFGGSDRETYAHRTNIFVINTSRIKTLYQRSRWRLKMIILRQTDAVTQSLLPFTNVYAFRYFLSVDHSWVALTREYSRKSTVPRHQLSPVVATDLSVVGAGRFFIIAVRIGRRQDCNVVYRYKTLFRVTPGQTLLIIRALANNGILVLYHITQWKDFTTKTTDCFLYQMACGRLLRPGRHSKFMYCNPSRRSRTTSRRAGIGAGR
jgi:hypothetical protein